MTDPKLAATNPMLRVTDLTHRVSLETDTLTILQGSVWKSIGESP